MKKILIIMPEYTIGGAEVQLRYIIERLEEECRDTEVFVLHQYGKMQDENLMEAKNRMHYITFVEFDMRNSSEYRIKWELFQFIHSKSEGMVYYCALLFHEWLTPIIPLLNMLGIYTIYSERVNGKSVSYIRSFRDSVLECDLILSNTFSAKKEIETSLGRQVKVIKNGKPYVEPFNSIRRKKITNLLIPCNIDRRKNIETVIQFISEFKEKNYHLKIIGEKRDLEYFMMLETLIDNLNIGPFVSFEGFKKNIRKEYEDSDIVILPSLSEGMPNVVLEAFAFGRPVVVSDVEYGKEIIDDNRMRFSPRNIYQLFDAVSYIENMDDNKYYEMLDHNKEIVRNEYGLKKMTDEYISLFNSIPEKSSVCISLEDKLLKDIQELSLFSSKQLLFYNILCRWIAVLSNGNDLSVFFINNNYRKIYIYGYKEMGRLLRKSLSPSIEVKGIIDRNAKTMYEDIDVISPKEIANIDCDVIVVTAIADYDSIMNSIKKQSSCTIISLESVIEYYEK